MQVKGTSHSPSGDAKASTTPPPQHSTTTTPTLDPQFSHEDPLCVNCLPVIHRGGSLDHEPPQRDEFDALAESYFNKLSVRAQRIAQLPAMQLLKDVPNSAAAMTSAQALVDLDRWTHSIHTASKVRDLNSFVASKLSAHELEVLEAAALLHDIGHRRGSHALDRVFAAHPGAPKISAWGWHSEFHEYHGARIVATQKAFIRELGDLHGDVVAVLCHRDNRIENGQRDSFERDFGAYKPTLSPQKIRLLGEIIEEVLDRDSCLELDYLRGGLTGGYVKLVNDLVKKFEGAITIYKGQLFVRIDRTGTPESKPGWISERDFSDYIACRQLFREVVAATPGSCNVDVMLRQSIFEQLELKGYSLKTAGRAGYEFLRNMVLRGEYEEILGQKVADMLQRAPHDQSLLSVEDVSAPLVTLTKADFKSPGKLKLVESEKALEVSGLARTDMTEFEYDLRRYLLSQKIQGDLFVVQTTDFEKMLQYRAIFADGGMDSDYWRFGCYSSSKAVKVVIAARAIDNDGHSVNLGGLQEIVERFCRSQAYLHEDALSRYDRHVFIRPVIPQEAIGVVKKSLHGKTGVVEPATLTQFEKQLVLDSLTSPFDFFTPEMRLRMKAQRLEWEERGEHGLKPSSIAPQ